MVVAKNITIRTYISSLFIALFFCVMQQSIADAPSPEEILKINQAKQEIELGYEQARMHPVLQKMKALYLEEGISSQERADQIVAFVKVYGKEKFSKLAGVDGSVATCVEIMTLMAGLTQLLEEIEDLPDDIVEESPYFISLYSGIELARQDLALIKKILHEDPVFENAWVLWNLQKSEMTQMQVQKIAQGLQYSLQMQQQQMMQQPQAHMPRWLSTGIGVVMGCVACVAMVESGTRSYKNYKESQRLAAEKKAIDEDRAYIIHKNYYVMKDGHIHGPVDDIWVGDAHYSPSEKYSRQSGQPSGPISGQLQIANEPSNKE